MRDIPRVTSHKTVWTRVIIVWNFGHNMNYIIVFNIFEYILIDQMFQNDLKWGKKEAVVSDSGVEISFFKLFFDTWTVQFGVISIFAKPQSFTVRNVSGDM